ncbi:lytic transglycosylase-like protein [Gottschalkia acidurici 9a]|uniref:Lytic transglycosylase-like protein n=1 Tax=Gottschalkia acidurici (strain ATCC 7906 / DSM 604 / BCRC 14475 / CIP 104303 / KCTC 5404 / NCIMB 10678 / 9a) TaxID=1128398 RepID=K0B034_GOTA9|nr:lytic transglycosylase domain-containing protein [Gottschalkia acidurici]AFS78006.1 lytic transglycosylase-like protein [Gottschalkia acidurici 9a]
MKIITIRLRTVIAAVLIMAIIAIGLRYGLNHVKKTIYPIKYQDYIKKYSKEYNIDPLFVASIIKVESKFDKDAQSIKNARGLMQIASITGEWAAKEIGIENYNDDLLYDPEVNIRIGCWYIDKLRKQFNNNLQLVVAAYNGGSGNVSKWLKDERYSEDGKMLKKIPFKETDEYVDKVFNSYEKYNEIYGKNNFLGEDD